MHRWVTWLGIEEGIMDRETFLALADRVAREYIDHCAEDRLRNLVSFAQEIIYAHEHDNQPIPPPPEVHLPIIQITL